MYSSTGPQVGMPVKHGRDLAHDLAGGQRDDEVVAGRREVGREDVAIDGVVEDVVRDALEEALVAGAGAPDLDAHPPVSKAEPGEVSGSVSAARSTTRGRVRAAGR